jgi:hypothetical protein
MKPRFLCSTAHSLVTTLTKGVPAALGLLSANNNLISFIALVNALTAAAAEIIITIIIIIIIAVIVIYVENWKNINFERGPSN